MRNKEGEPIIHLNRLTSLPSDAQKVLWIRQEVQRELKQRSQQETPIDDLIIEGHNPTLRRLGSEVVNPIVFMFPNPLLWLLSQFESYQIIEG